MDGFTGFKTATSEELPDAVAVMDPFHVVRLAGDALDQCRRRVQQDLHGHRGRSGDPLYGARRTLHTGADLLTDKQTARLDALFAQDAHVQVEATWRIYQRMITAYRDPDRAAGLRTMRTLIDALSTGVPAQLTELNTLGRTLKRRAADVLAYFTRPGTSNGPTEAINGRLEHLRGSALGLPQPHQLHRQITTRDRRVQTTATPSSVKSQLTARVAINRRRPIARRSGSTTTTPVGLRCPGRLPNPDAPRHPRTVHQCDPHNLSLEHRRTDGQGDADRHRKPGPQRDGLLDRHLQQRPSRRRTNRRTALRHLRRS